MKQNPFAEHERRLNVLLSEMKVQDHVSASYEPDTFPFVDQMKRIEEYINVDEYEIAYETIVAALEGYPFVLSGRAAVALLEAGLMFGYKTHLPKDALFDRR